ncbi:hypothetical protein MNBD_GAMMA13-787 [hydrothermal vent metagenome]|uniref:PEP-CTERM protein-sorting domain-containing protein n=1 Tax=hydrothermal vent metagenome TaxID=652676 RepID=A0A3B0Y4Z7_9ZZZZ
MKKFIVMLGLALFSQQSMAIPVAGIDFLDIANTVNASVGTYETNYQAEGAAGPVDSIVDGNSASYIFSNDATATVDVSFGSSIFDVADVDLTLLFVGAAGHSGTITLLGGSSDGSSADFDLAPSENYTGFNSVQDTVVFGIFSETLDLNSLFSGTFSGVMLDISDASAVLSLVGTTAPVPVPAAVWLFGSGLLGLVGIARKRRR